MTELTKRFIETKSSLEELSRHAMEYNDCTGEYEHMYDCEINELEKPILDFMYSCVCRIEELEDQVQKLKK